MQLIRRILVTFALCGGFLLASAPESAQAAAYCTGKVTDILIRSNGDISVLHDGSATAANWMVAPSGASEATKDRWVALLNSALLSGRNVQLYFSGAGTCGSMANGSVFGYVLLNN